MGPGKEEVDVSAQHLEDCLCVSSHIASQC